MAPPLNLSNLFLLFLLNPFFLSNANSPKLPFLNSLIGARKGHDAEGLSELKKHLSSLGYMKIIINPNDHNNNNLFDDNLELALKKYQVFFRLQPTGTLDSKTVEHLRLPRCGVPDFVNVNASQFQNHQTPTIASHYTFFPGEPKWPPTKTSLTYSFPGPAGTRKDVMRPIREATKAWANVTHFKFTYIKDYDHADIKISFQEWNHGDGVTFDGPRGILAHAFAPSDGRLHYDGSETWVDGIAPGKFDLQTIGLHELGHVLGLGHSTDGGAVMSPTIGDGFRKGLGQDDINGIKALYRI